MKIVFWNKKGGVGKTTLAYTIARDLGYYLLSNDDSIIEIAYPGKAKIIEKLPLIKDDVIYDLGGFVDMESKDVISAADLIVIPTTADLNAIKRTASTISDVKHVNPSAKILLVANRAKGEEFTELEKHFSDYRVIEIPESRIFEKALKRKSSVEEIGRENKFFAYTYRKVLAAYEELINTIKKETK